MTAKKDGDLTEQDLFKQAMAGVTPLKSKNTISHQTPQPKKILRKIETPDFETVIPLSDHCAVDILPEQHLSFVKSGVQPLQFRQLKQGKIPVQAELDLHGSTIDQAREQFLRFIQQAQQRGCRCVRIIHGKGYRGQTKIPILKSKVFTWLRQMPNVLAFSSCQPKDGGTGATYVLLSNK